MDGPQILTTTLTRPGKPDRYGNTWQYHSRSDRHSKVACWGVMFDALQHSSRLRRHVEDGRVVFGINTELRDFRTGRSKKLDLVLARPAGAWNHKRPPMTLRDLAFQWSIRLDDRQQELLETLPQIHEGSTGIVLAALEAKACMTAHIKALPRLFDELNSSHATVHANTDSAISLGLALVNASPTFISTDMNKHDLSAVVPVLSEHPQPIWAQRTIAKLHEVPRRSGSSGEGFDAFGITVVDMKNDNTPARVLDQPPAPQPGAGDHYDQMLNRFVHLYNVRNAHL